MPIPDRQKQRREYLRKKTVASLWATGIAVLCLACFLFTYNTAAGYIMRTYGWSRSTDWRRDAQKTLEILFGGLLVPVLITSLLAVMSVRKVRAVTAIPFVAPVTGKDVNL